MAIAPRVEPVDENTPTDDFIGWTLERFRNRRMVITTSFGMEGCALIDMYAGQGAAVTVVYIDTGFFFPETYALRDRMVSRYPMLTYVNRGLRARPPRGGEDPRMHPGARVMFRLDRSPRCPRSPLHVGE